MIRIAVFSLLVASVGGVAAEPTDLYGSSEELRLGRLFLTPDEREDLEARRGVAVGGRVSSDPVAAVAPKTAAANQRPAAGVIVAKGGRPLVWVDGEFRRIDSAAVEDVVFSAAVSIRVHGPPSAKPAADAGRDDSRGRPADSGGELVTGAELSDAHVNDRPSNEMPRDDR